MGKPLKNKFFKTAGMTFEVRTEYPLTDMTFHPRLSMFETRDHGPDPIVIEHFFSIPAAFKKLEKKDALSSRPMWTIFKNKTAWVYKKTPALPVSEDDTAFFEFEHDFTTCRVYSDFLGPEDYADGRFTSLTLFGCDQVLISRLLTDRQGMVLHSNGFVRNGKGSLLAGTSGAGKTTLTQMLKTKNFQIVSDDRTIVKMEENQAVMHGSWLHGTTPVITNSSYPLNSVFFLEQADENKIIPVHKNNEKISSLLQAVVRPHITAEEWNTLLDNVEKLVKHVACYRLLFDLSGNIIKILKEIK
jgi:hypothetical protein